MASFPEPVGNNSTIPEASLAASPDSPLKALYSHGLCRSLSTVNATTPLSCLPWTYYLVSIAPFALLILGGIIPFWMWSNRDLFKFTVLCPFSLGRACAVFLLSVASLGFNFFEPYLGNDEKLGHGWYGPGPSNRTHLIVDLGLNILLLLLLLTKPIKDKRAGGGVQVWQNYQRFLDSLRELSHLKALMSRVLQDWEFVANVANLPLLVYEIVCVTMDCSGPFAYWKVTATSLQFLRLFCLTMFCDETIRIFRKMPISVGTVLTRITWIVCLFFSFSAWIQLVETLGDPWSSTYNGQKDMTYGKVVTFLYGKLVFLDVTQTQLDTAIAKISVYVAQAIALIFLVQIIPDMLKQLPAMLQIRSFGGVYRQRDAPYILLLGSVNSDAVERFAETFRSTNREENIVVLLEPNTSDSATEEMHTVAGKHKDILAVVSGSVFDKNDLKNVMSDNCQCAFFFANESAQSFADEDHCNFLRVHTLKQQYPKTRVIVKVLLFENKERFYHIPSWFKKDKVETPDGGKPILHQADRVVCTGEIQFALLAQRYFASGISAVVTGWFSQSNGQTVRSLFLDTAHQSNRASANREDSCDQRFVTPRNRGRAAAEEEESFELNRPPQPETSIQMVAPQPVTYKKVQDVFESQAVLFAVLQDGEYHLHPRENLILQPGAKLFFITALSSDQLKKKTKDVSFDLKEKCTIAAAPAKSKELKLTARIQSVEQGGSGDMVCDVTGQYWRHLLLPQAEIPLKFPNEMKRLQLELKQHVVVCVVSDRNPSPIGLVNLIKPLRAVHIQAPTVVVLAESDFLAVEYPSLSDLPHVHFVKGDPLNDNHLDAINVQECRLCIVLDASERPKEQSAKWQAQLSGADLWPILPKHFFRHVNAVLATVSVAKFLDRIRRNHKPAFLPEEVLTCLHHEAVELIAWNQEAGKTIHRPKITADCTSPSFIDALMLQCYEDKDIFDAVRMLLVNGYRDVSRATSNHSSRGCEYIGNQGKLSRMTFVKDSNQQGLSYSPATSSGSAPSDHKIDVPIDIDPNGEENKFNQLCRRAADQGFLIIGTQPAVPVDDLAGPSSTAPYEYFVLERPFYVKERQTLFATVEKSLLGCSSQECRDILCALEFLPAFILKAVEEGSNGLPIIFRPYNCERDSHPKWFFIYYRIVAELYAVKSHTTSDSASVQIVDRDLYRLLTVPLKTYDNLNLPKLPEAILTYVLHIYRHQYTNLPPVRSNIPQEAFFYGIKDENYAASVRRNLQWKHLAAEHLNWKQLAFGDRA